MAYSCSPRMKQLSSCSCELTGDTAAAAWPAGGVLGQPRLRIRQRVPRGPVPPSPSLPRARITCSEGRPVGGGGLGKL